MSSRSEIDRIDRIKKQIEEYGIKCSNDYFNIDYENLLELVEQLKDEPCFPREVADFAVENNSLRLLILLYEQGIQPRYPAIRKAAKEEYIGIIDYLYTQNKNIFTIRFLNSLVSNNCLNVLEHLHNKDETLLPNVEGANNALLNKNEQMLQYLNNYGIIPDPKIVKIAWNEYVDELDKFKKGEIKNYPKRIPDIVYEQHSLLSLMFNEEITKNILNPNKIEVICGVVLFYLTLIGKFTNSVILTSMVITYFVGRIFFYNYNNEMLFLLRTFLFICILMLDKYLFYDFVEIMPFFFDEKYYLIFGMFTTGIVLNMLMKEKIHIFTRLFIIFICFYYKFSYFYEE